MTAPVPRPRRPRWHQWWVVGLVAACIVPATIVMFQVAHLARVVDDQRADKRKQDAVIERLIQANERQAKTLEANGLPTAGSPGADGKAGTRGADGKAGRDGKDGLSIRGQTGQPGAAGRDGKDATPAKDGKDGAAGQDGASVQGPPGPPGRDGLDGKDGRDGTDGKDGKDGAPGPAPVAIQVPVVGGGWCFATDPDGDGVYMCPEAAA